MDSMMRAEFEAEREARALPLPYAPDWLVTSCSRVKDAIYRYHVTGINLNFPEGHPQRKFEWTVPSLSWRFVWAF